jgi:hypothetical protein
MDNVSNLYAAKASPTFSGTVTFPDASTITDYLKSTTAASTYLTTTSASSTYAPKASPTFSGTVTFPDASTITDYLKSTTAASTYLTTTSASSTYAPKASPTFSGTVTFPVASTITDYLKSTTAASTYLTTTSASSTYVPLASPTFTGSIKLNGDVTLASAYTNTLTLNDHLVLCTGSNFTTPVSGQQGHIMTGTLETDRTSITSGTATKYATLNLTYGVWLIIGQIGYFNVNNSGTNTSASISNKFTSIHTTSGTANALYGLRQNFTSTVGLGIENHETVTRVATVNNSLTNYYLNSTITYTGGPLTMYNLSTNFYAVRIA